MSLINRGIKNSSYLMVSRLINLCSGLFISIFITRNLSLNEYGYITTIFSYVILFTHFSFNGISSFVMRESAKDINKMSALITKTISMKFVFGLFSQLLCVSCLIFAPYSNNIKILIICYSFYITLNSFLNHWIIIFDVYEKFIYKAIINIIPNIIYLISALVVLYYDFEFKVILLVVMNLISFLIATFLCYIFSKRFCPFKNSIFSFYFNKNIIIGGTYFFIISTAGLLFAKIDIFMLSFLGSEQDVAVYNIANRLSRQLIELRIALYAGFFPVLIKEISNKTIKLKEIYRVTFIIFIFSIPLSLLISYFSEDAITLVYTNKYLVSGQLFSILIFFVFIDFIIQPYVMTLLASDQERFIALLFTILAVLNISLNIILFSYCGVWGIAYSTIFTYLIYSISILTFGINKLKIKFN